MSRGAENLDREQMVQVIEFFMYRCNPEQRVQLMASLPQVYNAYYGEEYARVVQVADGEPVPVTKRVLTDDGFQQVPVVYPKAS